MVGGTGGRSRASPLSVLRGYPQSRDVGRQAARLEPGLRPCADFLRGVSFPFMHVVPLKSKLALFPVYIVDDEDFVREALQAMLEEAGIVVETFPSAEGFLEAFRPERPCCILIDADLPGMSGLELLRRHRAAGHPWPAIMITGHSNIRAAVEAIKAGASNFLEKPVSSAELLMTIGRAVEEFKDAGRGETKHQLAASQLASLTARQRQILDKILAGQANKNIAADLGISRRTVETHRAAIMKKTGAKSVTALARLAFAGDPGRDVAQDRSQSTPVEPVIAPAGVAGEPEGEQFKRFFDQVPLAIVIAAIVQPEHIVYANPQFEELSGQRAGDVIGKTWSILSHRDADGSGQRTLGSAIAESSEFVGSFRIEPTESELFVVDAYSNAIEDEDGIPTFRLAALVPARTHDPTQKDHLEKQILEKDVLLLEFQHRVKNNLQMITSLIRVEAKNARSPSGTLPFDRLAGRVNSLHLLYKLLSDSGKAAEIDLGVYLSEIVSSVMHSHAIEGIRLNLKVDAYPVSVNVAMPTGLVVNELLTNALKHAFVGRDGGTITLHSISNNAGCKVVIADDGVGLPPGVVWPKQGKLGALIVRSLRQNARAELTVESSPGKGTCITIEFTRAAAAPDAVQLSKTA